MLFVWDGGIYNGWPQKDQDGSVWRVGKSDEKFAGVKWWTYCPSDALPG
jgi:hypothetical protein